MTCDMTNPIFSDEAKAMRHLEASRWPEEVTCPFCGAYNVHRMAGKTQAGMFLCNACRDKFTARTGTVMERSHIQVHKWLLATHLMSSSKKGISAHQLHRMLGITYKSAWFMAHRIREAMKPAIDAGPLGGDFRHVEADETELAKSKKTKGRHRRRDNLKVLSLIERDGRARSFRIDDSNLSTIKPLMEANLRKDSRLSTDMGPHWMSKKMPFPHHEKVDHSKEEYVRRTPSGDKVSTNTAEGYFSLFKRGLVGTYQHMSEQHLPRYLAEFDFRQNNRERLGVNDAGRAARVLKGAEGKRLTYQQSR
jgi:transposase-like protein